MILVVRVRLLAARSAARVQQLRPVFSLCSMRAICGSPRDEPPLETRRWLIIPMTTLRLRSGAVAVDLSIDMIHAGAPVPPKELIALSPVAALAARAIPVFVDFVGDAAAGMSSRPRHGGTRLAAASMMRQPTGKMPPRDVKTA
jgi:hypothetical protein